jgi:hypothetical protein
VCVCACLSVCFVYVCVYVTLNTFQSLDSCSFPTVDDGNTVQGGVSCAVTIVL